MSPWEVVEEYWREKIVNEFRNQGIDQEKYDPTGEGIEMSILPDVLAGATVEQAVRDWVDWRLEDILEREKEDDQDDLSRGF